MYVPLNVGWMLIITLEREAVVPTLHAERLAFCSNVGSQSEENPELRLWFGPIRFKLMYPSLRSTKQRTTITGYPVTSIHG